MNAWLNLLVLGVGSGSMYALIAVSFGLIWSVSKVFHLAHGATAMLAGYVVYFAEKTLGLPLWPSLVPGLLAAILFGVVLHLGIYQPLERRNAPFSVLFMASVAVMIAIGGLLGVAFGSDVQLMKGLSSKSWQVGSVNIGLSRIVMACSWILIAVLLGWLKFARFGRAVRAVGDSPRISSVLGLRSGQVLVVVYAVGSALVFPAVIMYSWNQGLSPDMAMPFLLIGSAAMMIAGPGRYGLAAVIAFIIGVAQAIMVQYVPSGWTDAVLYAVVLLAVIGGALGPEIRRFTVRRAVLS